MVTTTGQDVDVASRRRHDVALRRRPNAWSALELAVGIVLLAAATVAGVILRQRPWPNRLDKFGWSFLGDMTTHRAQQLVHLGSDQALVVGVVIFCGFALWQRDWVRAVVCVVAPVGAVILVQLVAKPLVARDYGGALSYPSGTVTVIAALAACLLLVAPGVAKVPAAIVGALAVVAVSLAVLNLHWHLLTDALGGICIGFGLVFALDSIGHLIFKSGASAHR